MPFSALSLTWLGAHLFLECLELWGISWFFWYFTSWGSQRRSTSATWHWLSPTSAVSFLYCGAPYATFLFLITWSMKTASGKKSSFRECDRRLAAICLLENHSSDNSLDQPRAMSLRVFPYQGQSYGHQNRHKDCFSDNLHCRPVPRGVCLHWIQNWMEDGPCLKQYPAVRDGLWRQEVEPPKQTCLSAVRRRLPLVLLDHGHRVYGLAHRQVEAGGQMESKGR